MSSSYRPPDFDALRAELARAGADDNGQISGALWIIGAMRGIAVPKATAGDAAKLQKLRATLEQAASQVAALPDPYREWLREDVAQPVDRATQALRCTLALNPGGQRQQAHRSTVDALQRYFRAEGLQVAVSTDSAFVRIFAHCADMDPEVAKTTVGRLLTG